MKRYRIIHWIAKRLCGVKEGEMLPRPLLWLNIALHPSLIFYRNKDWYYDFESRSFYILGSRYSWEFFECISFGEVGKKFQIIKRDTYDGFIYTVISDIKDE